MPNQLIDDAIQIEFTVKADIENDLKRLSSGIQKVVQDSNSALTKLSSSFSGLGRAITNAMQVPDVGTTFINKYKKMFDEMKIASKDAYDAVKKNNLEIEKSFIEVQKLSAERLAVGVRKAGTEKQEEWASKQAVVARKKADTTGLEKDIVHAEALELNYANTKKKLEALTAEYNNIGAKQKEVYSQIYLNQGQLANTVISNLTTNAEKAVKTIKDVVTAQTNELNKLGKISPKSGLVENIKTVKTDKGTVDFAGKELEKLYKVQRDLEKSQLDAMKMQVTAYTAYQQQTDAALRESNRILWEQSVANVNKYEEALKKLTPEITKLQEKHKEAFKLQELNTETLQNQYKKQGVSSLLGGKDAKALEDERVAFIARLEKLYAEQSRLSKDFSKSGVKRGEQIRDEFKQIQSQYVENRNKIVEVIRELQSLTKSGILHADVDIVQLKKLQAEYDKTVNKIKTDSASLATMTKAQEQGASVNRFTRMWESVRDFRWQYAAVMYLATQAARAIENIFVNALNKVGEFRNSIYSIAASISMSVAEPMTIVFDKVFAYAERVMTKLTVASTKSYASLEDLVVLTKTFAQAGVVPVTDEDFKKIALVGTAIKILTEDMVNSGTQMRQELYAFIQGRARATDQLAMMFKILGKDIKEEMKTWEKEGKTVLDGLAQLLTQFGPINERIAKEYTNQVKLLKEMWNYIERIALTDFVKSVAGDLEKLIAKFGSLGEGLTPLGQATALALKESFEALYNTIISLGSVLGNILDIFGSVVFHGENLDDKIKSIKKEFGELPAIMVSIARGLLAVTNLAIILRGVSRDITSAFKDFKNLFGGAVNTIMGSLGSAVGFKGAPDTLMLGLKEFKEGTEGLGEMWGQMWGDIPTETEKAQLEAEENIKKFEKNLENLGKKAEETGDKLGFSIIKSVGHLTELGVEVEKEFKKITAKSEDKVFQIYFEADESKKKLDEWYEGLKKSHQATLDWIAKNDVMSLYNKGLESGLTPEKSWEQSTETMDKMYSISSGTKGRIEQAEKYYVDLYKTRENKLNEYYAQEARQESNAKQEYMNYLFNLQESNLNAYDKLEKQTEDYYAEIQEKALTNKYFHDNLLQLQGEVYERYLRAKKQLDIESNDERLDIIRSAYGKELTALEKLESDKQNLLRKLDKTDKIRQEEKAAIALEIAKGNAERVKKLEQDNARTLASTQAQTLSLQAKLLSTTSISPADKQKAQIMEIVSAYKEQELQIEKNIEAAKLQFTEGTKEYEAYKSMMYEQLALQKQIAEAQIRDIQEPFWAKMKQMAQGWADSIADALTEMTMDFKNWKKTLNDLFKSISKDVIKAFIKTSITDPMMSALTGKSEGGKGVLSSSSNNLLGLFGGKGGNLGTALGLDEKSSQVDKYMKQYGIFGTGPISSTNPLPVMVTNMGEGGGFLPSTTSTAGVADLQKTFKSTLAESTSKWFPISSAANEKINVGMEFLTNKGLSVSDASAILGNAYLESGLKTTSYNAKEGAYGIFQHRLDRLSGLKGFAGSEIDDYVTQLEYGWKELNTSHKKALEKMQEAATTEEKTLAFRKYFEVASPESDKARISYAKQIENQYLSSGAEGINKVYSSGGAEGTTKFLTANAEGTTKFLTANVEGSMSKISDYAEDTTNSFKQVKDYSGDTVVDFKDVNADSTKLANNWENAYTSNTSNMPTYSNTGGFPTNASNVSQMIVNAGSVSVSGSISGMGMPMMSGGSNISNLLSGKGTSNLSNLFGGGKNTSNLFGNSSLFGGTSNLLTGLFSGIQNILKSVLSLVSNLLSGITSLVGNLFGGGSSNLGGKSSGGLFGNLFGGGGSSNNFSGSSSSMFGNLWGNNKTGKSSGGLLGNLFGGSNSSMNVNAMTVNAQNVSLSQGGLQSLTGGSSNTGGLFGGSNTSNTGNTGGSTCSGGVCGLSNDKSMGGSGGSTTGGGSGSSLFGGFGNIFSGIFGFIKNLISGLGSIFKSIFSGLGSLFSGGGSLFGGGGSSLGSGLAFAEGGVIGEPVVGKGLYTGQSYTFGENEPEVVVPQSKLIKSSKQSTPQVRSTEYHVHMGGIAINSIDTQTGTDFLVKNSDIIQGMMIKQLKNNKQIRRALPNSY